MSQIIPLRTRVIQCPPFPTPPNIAAYSIDSPSHLARDLHRYGQDAENWAKGMQVFATYVNEIIKINIAPRVHYNHHGWAVEFDFPDTRQHHALVDATVERANTIITEFLELGDFVLEPSSPRKRKNQEEPKTSVRQTVRGSVHRRPSAVNEAKTWSLARDGMEERVFPAVVESKTENFPLRHSQGQLHAVVWAPDQTFAQLETQADAETEARSLEQAVERVRIEGAQAQQRANRQKKVAEQQKKQEAIRFAKAENENAALKAAAQKAEAEAAAMRLKEEQKTQAAAGQVQASRGTARPARGHGSRRGRLPTYNRDSTFVDRSTTTGSILTPQIFASVGGSIKKASAPAVKAESIPPEIVVPTPTRSKAPPNAAAPKSLKAPRKPKVAKVPKGNAMSKTGLATKGAMKAKNPNSASKKRVSAKQAEVSEGGAEEPPPKKNKKNSNAGQAATPTFCNSTKNGEAVRLSIEIDGGQVHDDMPIDITIHSPSHGYSMTFMESENAQQNQTGEEFQQFLRENAFEDGSGKQFFQQYGNEYRNGEQVGLGIDVDHLLTFDDDIPETCGNSEDLTALLRANDYHGEALAINDMLGDGKREEAGNGDFELGSTFEINMVEQAANTDVSTITVGENPIQIMNGTYTPQSPNLSSFVIHGQNTFIDNDPEQAVLMENAGSMVVARMVEQIVKTDCSLSGDKFWDAKPGPADGFDELLGENTFEVDSGEGRGKGDMYYMFQHDFEMNA